MMVFYQKKPVRVEAMIYPGHYVPTLDEMVDFEKWIKSKNPKQRMRYRGQCLIIETLEGDMRAMPGDYVICGVKGELYPCKADIFAETYDEVETA